MISNVGGERSVAYPACGGVVPHSRNASGGTEHSEIGGAALTKSSTASRQTNGTGPF